MVDCHLHSSVSGDSETPAEDMLRAAIQLGLKHICFTEHLDVDFPEEVGIDFTLHLDLYDAMRQRMAGPAEASGIQVGFGVEVGMKADVLQQTLDELHLRPYDFVVGSIHVIDGADMYMRRYFKGITQQQAIHKYLNAIYENICVFGDYDVVGHVDYVLKSPFCTENTLSYRQYGEWLDAVFQQVICQGKGIEINTSVYQAACSALHGLDWLRRYREMGGEIITIGSDSHVVEKVGYGVLRAMDMLRRAGFKYYTVFMDRKPAFLPL